MSEKREPTQLSEISETRKVNVGANKKKKKTYI